MKIFLSVFQKLLFCIVGSFLLSCNEKVVESTSPNNEKIYKILFTARDLDYYSSFALCTINSDGTALKKLINFDDGRWPKWSYDGTQIIFAKFTEESYYDENYDICVIDSNGSNLRKIARGNTFICSPFENKICFMKNVNKGGVIFTSEIYTINIDGSGLTELYDKANLNKYSLAWSNSRNEILTTIMYVGPNWDDAVISLNTDDKSIQNILSAFRSLVVQGCIQKDGSFIFTALKTTSPYTNDLYKYDATLKTTTPITINADCPLTDISPSGNMVLYQYSGGNGIWVINSDLFSNQFISPNYLYTPRWLPDNKRIVIGSIGENKSLEIGLIDIYNKNKLAIISTNSESLQAITNYKRLWISDVMVCPK